jgi:hypothetical protein
MLWVLEEVGEYMIINESEYFHFPGLLSGTNIKSMGWLPDVTNHCMKELQVSPCFGSFAQGPSKSGHTFKQSYLRNQLAYKYDTKCTFELLGFFYLSIVQYSRN